MFLITAAAWGQPEIYLDAMPGALDVKQGWGNLGLKTAAWAQGKPQPLQIGEKEYARGLGHHAPGEIRTALDGRYRAFRAEVGVQRMGARQGSVVFQVWVDGKKRFDSGVMKGGDPAKPVEIELNGARELRLVAGDAGDGISCDMADWAEARLVRDGRIPILGAPVFALSGTTLENPLAMEGNQALVGRSGGSQIAFSRPLGFCSVAVEPNEEFRVTLPLSGISGPFTAEAELAGLGGPGAEAWLELESGARTQKPPGNRTLLTLHSDGTRTTDSLVLGFRASGRAGLRVVRVRCHGADWQVEADLIPPPAEPGRLTPRDVALNPRLEREMLEWDWRMQDGIGAGVTRRDFAEATSITLARGNALMKDTGKDARTAWAVLCAQFEKLKSMNCSADDPQWEDLWRRVHTVRRKMMLSLPLAKTGPLLFARQAPGTFSHQLTQYYGRYARPGGGLYVLDRPGVSLQARPLFGAQASSLQRSSRQDAGAPGMSLMQPEVTHDGKRVLVACCAVDSAPTDTIRGAPGHYYHLWEVAADGSSARQLTEGAFDDFAPKELPNGQIIFVSTRRGGWHRCGTPGCEVYTLALMNADGGSPRTLSFHETQEWDPAVLNDGRVIYTRWDYVDRHAVFYEQLWTVRPDGSAPAAFYGNNTFNPVGVWEARAVPGSRRVMATAAAHHGMTAGSIVLIDPTRGVDGAAPLTRLTPDAPFPESEALLLPKWRSAVATEPPARTVEMDRWPGQCYRSPYPLSEDLFLAAYSFDPLVGEPKANAANMFGLYLVDASGNKELLHRDLNISSVWPMPLRARVAPPEMPSALVAEGEKGLKGPKELKGLEGKSAEGVYFLQNVYASNPGLPVGGITRLRVIQVLPKSTPGINNPTVGAANASPGKQVLGTVPVEADGSACFRAPAGIPLAFQALDADGEAVQVMRSVSYLQPGETASCVGCHEPRQSAPVAQAGAALATRRPPSAIEPGPDGSRPLSFPILVQPVLDKYCVRCHGGEKDPKAGSGDSPRADIPLGTVPKQKAGFGDSPRTDIPLGTVPKQKAGFGDSPRAGIPLGTVPKPSVNLTGAAEGRYTRSYNALVERVSFSAWGRGAFPEGNSEPLARPGFFGAKGSPLMRMLREGHHGVKLERGDFERLATWMDANALFYGTFDPAGQARQQRGERIEGPALE